MKTLMRKIVLISISLLFLVNSTSAQGPHTWNDKYYGFEWSADGKKLAFQEEFGSLLVSNADGSNIHEIVETSSSGKSEYRYPYWSTDSSMLAIWHRIDVSHNQSGGSFSWKIVNILGNILYSTPSSDWDDLNFNVWENDSLGFAYTHGNIGGEAHIVNFANNTDIVVGFNKRILSWDSKKDRIIAVKNEYVASGEDMVFYILNSVGKILNTFVFKYKYPQCSMSPSKNLIACIHEPHEKQVLSILSVADDLKEINHFNIAITGYLHYPNAPKWSFDGNMLLLATVSTCCRNSNEPDNRPLILINVVTGQKKTFSLDYGDVMFHPSGKYVFFERRNLPYPYTLMDLDGNLTKFPSLPTN